MPSNSTDQFERSLDIGEKSFTSLIEDSVPVWPELYEVIYAYNSGVDNKIVSAIDSLKKDNKALDIIDLQKIHEDYFSDSKLLDISENIGSKINDEIQKIAQAMNVAGDRSQQCDSALSKIETKFSNVTTAEQLHSVVEILGDITKAIADNNQNLNTKLEQSTQQIDVLHKDLEIARNESNTDALTGLANRKKFDSALRASFKDADWDNNDLCLLFVDIDRFKAFNDTYGHQTGDQILRLVAHTLRNGLKGRDLPARYGGEEFAVILPETNTEGAFVVAEQVREAIAAKELIKRSTGENLGHLTVSIGIAKATGEDTPTSLIERSDKALYEAKDTGRNRCVIADSQTVEEDLEIAV